MKEILFTIFIFVLGWRLGVRVLRMLCIDAPGGGEGAMYQAGAGLWAVSLAVLLTSAVSCTASAVWGVLAVVAAAVALLDARSVVRQELTRGAARGPRMKLPMWVYPFLALLAVAVAVNVFRCFLPPIEFDVLSYHLAVPKYYLMAGRIVFIPTNVYSNFPQTVEMLYLPMQALGLPRAAALVHAGFGLLSAGLVYTWMSRRYSRAAAVVSAAAFYLMPLTLVESGAAMVDLASGFFGAAALMAAAPGERETGPRYSLAALFAGIAVSTKWSCGLIPFILVAFMIFRMFAERKTPRPAAAAKFILLIILPALPYAVKNFILTGNPVWPLLAGVFGARGFDTASAKAVIDGIKGFGAREMSLVAMLRAPWDFTMHETAAGGALSPVFLSFIPLYFLARKNRAITFLIAAGLVYVPLWYFTLNLSARFLSPVIVVLSAAVGYVVCEVRPGALRAMCITVLVLQLAASFGASVTGESSFAGELRVVTGAVPRDTFLTAVLPEYGPEKWVNTHARPGEKALLGEILVKGYYLDVPYYWGHPVFQKRYDYERMLTPGELRDALASDGVAYIIFRLPPAELFGRGTAPFMSHRAKRLWRDFIGGCTEKVYDDGRGSVYRLGVCRG